MSKARYATAVVFSNPVRAQQAVEIAHETVRTDWHAEYHDRFQNVYGKCDNECCFCVERNYDLEPEEKLAYFNHLTLAELDCFSVAVLA